MVTNRRGDRNIMECIRVVLADDHPLMRLGIRKMLSRTGDIEVVGEASNGYEALEMVSTLEPDVLLLDMEMPGMKGYEVAQELEASGSPVPILVLSAYEDRQYILGVLASGAAGYLTKEELPETIVKAVRGVARGEQGWVSKRIAHRIEEWIET
jgi:DNA-binding NarL/FixJ family response regulator